MSATIVATQKPGSRPLAPGWRIAFTGIGLLALVLFAWMVCRAHPGYSDFDQIYMAGFAVRHGITPYQPTQPPLVVPHAPGSFAPTSAVFAVYYYAPLCGLLAAPLSLLPFPLAALVWRLLCYGLLLGGLWWFSRLALPEWPASVRLLALGACALAGSVRWNLVNQQPTALIVALLTLFACALLTNRPRLAGALAVLASIKVSYLLPVVGLLAFRRDWRLLGGVLAAIVVLNVAALLPTDPVETISTYRASIRHFEDPGNQTYPSALDFLAPYLDAAPNSPLYAARPRHGGLWAGEQIHAAFTFSAWTRDVRRAKLLSALFDLALLGFFVALWRRAAATDLPHDTQFLTLLFAALLGGSLLIVYHQRYDAIAFLPLAYATIARLRAHRRNGIAWVTLAATLLFAFLLSDGLLNRWQMRAVVPHGLLILAPVCGYLAMAAGFGGVAMLWRYAQENGGKMRAVVEERAPVREAEPVR